MLYSKSYMLKDKAKDALRGHYRLIISVLLMNLMIQTLADFVFSNIIQLPSAVYENFDPLLLLPKFILFTLLSFLVTSLLGILGIGMRFIYLKIACGAEAYQHDLIYGYQTEFAKSFKLSAIQNGVLLLALTPSRFFLNCYRCSADNSFLNYAVIAILIGICVYAPLGLALSPMYFILLDFPEKKASEVVGLSFKIMKGHKLRFLWLVLSFLPMMLLGLFTFYVGYLWIIPYLEMSYTQFYLDLMKSE